ANAKASSTNGPMPGTLRWIMNGITLMPAPTIEQTPVAVRPASPISRARRGSMRPVPVRVIAGFYPFERLHGDQEVEHEMSLNRRSRGQESKSLFLKRRNLLAS